MVLGLDIIKLFKEIIEIPGWIETNWMFLETSNISGWRQAGQGRSEWRIAGVGRNDGIF